MAPRTFLHVGCGTKHKDKTTREFASDRWRELRLDIDASVPVDIVSSMTDMAPVADESCDAIYSSHNIEHLYAHEVVVALREFRRVLRPGGFVVITCPDLQAVCAAVAKGGLVDAVYESPAGPIAPIDILYGHRGALAAGQTYMAHRCGFTEKTLVATLRGVGFAGVASQRTWNWHLWAVATRDLISEDAIRQLAADHFPLEMPVI